MFQNTSKKSMSLGIEVVIVLAVALVFVIMILLIVLPQLYGANHSLIGFGDKIVDSFTPKK